MPYKSDKQRKYFNANRDKLEAEGVDVGHWNESSRGKKLPEKVAVEIKKAFGEGSSVQVPGLLSAPISGGLSGGALGALAGGAYGASKGDTVEGVGRGAIRGGLTGAGAITGASLGSALGGNKNSLVMALLGALGGGAAGWLGSGKLLGKSRFPERDKQSFDLGVKAGMFGAPAGPQTFSPPTTAKPPAATQPTAAPAATATPASTAPTTQNSTPQINTDAAHRGGDSMGGMKIALNKEDLMKLSNPAAVTKMAHYVNYLAARVNGGRQALHIKQAKVNRLVKLSAALGRTKNIVAAIKLAYPEMNEQQRFKTATWLINGLAAKMRKAAAIQKRAKAHRLKVKGAAAKKAMGMMGAAGGVGGSPALGGDGGIGPAGGDPSTAAGTSSALEQALTGGAGVQTAPSYSAEGAPTQVGSTY